MSSMSSKGTGARRWTMPDIKRANAAAGRHYFSRDTQRFFGPETYHGPYQGPGGVYFVKVGQRTGIKVVQFDPATGDVDTVHNMPAPTLDEGRKMAKAAAAGAKPNGRAAEPANEVEAEELVLYTANERALYDRRKAFYDSALRKVRAGTYDPAKAPALFVYLADEAAKHYRTAYHMGTGFSPATRRLAAEKFAREFEGSDEYAEAVAAKGQRGKGKAAARKRNAGAVVRRTFTVQPGSGYYIVNQRRPTGGYDVVARLDTEGDAEALVGALDNAIDEYLRDNHGRHLRNPGARATHRSYDVEPYSGYYRVVERKDGRPGLHVILSGLSENDAVSVADALHNVLVAFQRDNGYAMRKANGARHARPEFTAHDLAVIAQTADRIRYSEDTPETVMLSTGYADVYPEGDHEASVTIHGVNWTFEEQQLHPERFRVKATRR